MAGIEEKLKEAERKAKVEKLTLPFSYDSLNTAYVLMRDQYLSHEKLFVPDELRTKVDEDCVKEMGEAESKLHSFMETLVRYFWDNKQVEIKMYAEGICPLHPNEVQQRNRVLDDGEVGRIKTPDYVMTSETVGTCDMHPNQHLLPGVSYLEYTLKDPTTCDGRILKFQSRIKRTTMINKLTRGIIRDKDYALDFRGARVICKDLLSYTDVSYYLINRVTKNGDITKIPFEDALEEHVSVDRDPFTYLKSAIPGLNVPFKKNPKSPHYQSLHILIRYQNVPIELQCRDIWMHKEAENGRAEHKKYKEEELIQLRKDYSDYDEVQPFVGGVYHALIPPGFKLSQEPFLLSGHNLEFFH